MARTAPVFVPTASADVQWAQTSAEIGHAEWTLTHPVTGRVITVAQQGRGKWEITDTDKAHLAATRGTVLAAKAEGRLRFRDEDRDIAAESQATPVQQPQAQAAGGAGRASRTRSTTGRKPASAKAAAAKPEAATARVLAGETSFEQEVAAILGGGKATPARKAPARTRTRKAASVKVSAIPAEETPAEETPAAVSKLAQVLASHRTKLESAAPVKAVRKASTPRATADGTRRWVKDAPLVAGESGRTVADLKAILDLLNDAAGTEAKAPLRAQRDILLDELMEANGEGCMAALVRAVTPEGTPVRSSVLTSGMRFHGRALRAEQEGAADSK